MGSSLLFYELKVVRIYHLHKRFIKDLPELVLFNTSLVPRPIFQMGLGMRLYLPRAGLILCYISVTKSTKAINWLYEQGREGYYEGKHTQSHLFIIFTNWKCSIINVPTNYMQSCLILRMIVQISVLHPTDITESDV